MEIRIRVRVLLALGILLCLSGFALPSAAPAPAWKAGIGMADITPENPIWMAGFAARKHASEGVEMPLHAKALALEDSLGNRCVIITSDLLGFPRAVSDPIARRLQERFKLRRDQVLFTSSHTHSGPVIRESLISMYPLDEAQAAEVRSYTLRLQSRVEESVADALKDLSPALLSFGRGQAEFGVNRRLKKETGYVISVNPEGPVDHEVPVLRIGKPDGSLRAVLFSYACHNTTHGGDNYRIHGDYAGFAQREIESQFPGARALFFLGCAADTNPNPRGTLELTKSHGIELAKSVAAVLGGRMQSLEGSLKSAYDHVDLPFSSPPTREILQKRLEDKDVYVQRHAKNLLEELNRKGSLPTSYSYPIGIVKFGKDLTLIALAGEVVVDYALRLRKELPPAEKLWVGGYSNDVFAYIASRRVIQEGGYEAETSMIYYGQPGPWAPEVEDVLIGKVRSMYARLR
jgi:neutral ceramidase